MSVNLYPDSHFYKRLTRCSNECHWDEFIDECEAHKIDVPKGCSPIFTSFLLLETIGLGGVLIPLQGDFAYKSLVKWIQAYIKGMPDPRSLNPSDLKKCQQEIAYFLDGMGEIFRSLLFQLPNLEINFFLKRFDQEISIFATSKAAGELIQLTLKRLRDCFTTHPTECLSVVIGNLGWNLIATFPFIEPDTISKDEAPGVFAKAEIWFNALFAAFHAASLKGNRVGFFRLAENRYNAYTKIIAKDPTNTQFTAAKTWLGRYKPLRRKDDLCDGELIDFAVLGSDEGKVICFTSDSHIDIQDRLILLKGTLEDMARDVEGWAVNPCWGSVYCISGQGEPLKIVHSFLWNPNRQPQGLSRQCLVSKPRSLQSSLMR